MRWINDGLTHNDSWFILDREIGPTSSWVLVVLYCLSLSVLVNMGSYKLTNELGDGKNYGYLAMRLALPFIASWEVALIVETTKKKEDRRVSVLLYTQSYKGYPKHRE